MSQTKTQKYFTVAQLAERWSIHHQTVREWIRGGRLEASRLSPGRGSRIRVSLEAVQRLEAEMAEDGAL